MSTDFNRFPETSPPSANADRSGGTPIKEEIPSLQEIAKKRVADKPDKKVSINPNIASEQLKTQNAATEEALNKVPLGKAKQKALIPLMLRYPVTLSGNREETIESYVAAFLLPYRRGEISAENEQADRPSLMKGLIDFLGTHGYPHNDLSEIQEKAMKIYMQEAVKTFTDFVRSRGKTREIYLNPNESEDQKTQRLKQVQKDFENLSKPIKMIEIGAQSELIRAIRKDFPESKISDDQIREQSQKILEEIEVTSQKVYEEEKSKIPGRVSTAKSKSASMERQSRLLDKNDEAFNLFTLSKDDLQRISNLYPEKNFDALFIDKRMGKLVIFNENDVKNLYEDLSKINSDKIKELKDIIEKKKQKIGHHFVEEADLKEIYSEYSKDELKKLGFTEEYINKLKAK